MIQAIKFFIALLRHPKTLDLNQDQAEYIEGLFMGGSSPEDIGRAMDRTYNRRTWLYFQTPNAKRDGFDFAESVDYELDGLEYLRSAMVTLGAIQVRKDGNRWYDYYQAAHPMVQKLAGIMTNAPVPESKRKGA